MKTENTSICGIPSLVIGEKSDNVYLFIHGKNGSKQEALDFAETACPLGFQVVGIDLAGHGERKKTGEKLLPWSAVSEIKNIYLYMKEKWKCINIRANSIGAWLSMLALQTEKIGKALFVSPIVDMENLIENMMQWANVTEAELQSQGEIATNFGETLSWKYLCWVRKHKIFWNVPTEILYAEKDNLTPRKVIDSFVATTGGKLTVMKNGEHWFHTEEQLRFLHDWEKSYCK